ncbi:MAG TPA: hypothetical protein ENH46_06025 [Candidatus Pacearchaeota archaeon]|nr:hypothetical protein [Candidatus Pacearchaeota archaeon]
MYYDEEECNEFYRVLDEKLTEDFFNELCDYFFELIEKGREVKTKKDIFEIIVMSWPALVVFEEISNYPEYADEIMLRRLIRVRKTTESFIYDISKQVTHDFYSDTYIFFQGNVIKAPFEEFIRIKNFKIVK